MIKLCFQNEYLTKELSNKERELELHKTQFQIKCKFFAFGLFSPSPHTKPAGGGDFHILMNGVFEMFWKGL